MQLSYGPAGPLVLPARAAGARWHSLNDMGLRVCARRNRLALDALLAGFFVVLDTVLTLAGTSWWPAHPGTLAWAMLAVQGLADASLVFRRRAPMLVIAILGGFSLVISLLISPAGLITPENAGTVWAPLGTVLAAYGPFYYRRDRRAAFAAVGTLTLIVARVWEPSASVIVDRRAEDRGRAAARALLHRAARGPAGPARPGRTRRAGALPARRAGQGRGTGPARGRNARRRDAPGQPDGAAGRRARHHRQGRSDQAGRGRTAGRGLPGAG